MLPLALPAVVSVSVLYSITVWNDYVAPSLYMRDIPTLAVGLEYLVSEYQAEANTTKIFAAMIITLIPILGRIYRLPEDDYGKYGRGRAERIKAKQCRKAVKEQS